MPHPLAPRCSATLVEDPRDEIALAKPVALVEDPRDEIALAKPSTLVEDIRNAFAQRAFVT